MNYFPFNSIQTSNKQEDKTIMSLYEYKAHLKRYVNSKKLQLIDPNYKPIREMPVPHPSIAIEAERYMELFDMKNYCVKPFLERQNEESSIDSDTTVANEDELLEITKWFVHTEQDTEAKSIYLRCKWKLDKTQNDLFDTVHADFPKMVAEYINKNKALYNMLKKLQQTISPECAQYITHVEEEKKVGVGNSKIAEETDILAQCENDHDDFCSYNDYGCEKYFAEGMKLHGQCCLMCSKNLSQLKINHIKPAYVCNKHGKTTCCICLCYECATSLNLNSQTKKARNRKIIDNS